MNKLLLRDIKNSAGRFIAILLIIMLGVLLFVGVKATGPSLNDTLQLEVNKQKLSDIRVISDKGFTSKDVSAAQKVQGSQIELSKFKYVIGGKNKDAVALYGLNSDLKQNQFKLTSGRLPKNDGEILLDQRAKQKEGYQLGDRFTFAKSADLKDDQYKIVGFVDSPIYIDDSSRGSANLGSGNVQYFAYVSDDSINIPVNNLMNIRFESLQQEQLFSDKYKTKLNSKLGKIKLALNKRKNARANEIASTGLSQIADAQAKLNEAQSQLAKTKAQTSEINGSNREANEKLEQQADELNQKQSQLESQKSSILKRAEPNYIWQERSDLPGFTGYGESSKRISAIANVFPAFFFLLAALITFTTVMRMVEESRGQIGTLKALGFSKMAIGYEYTSYAFWAGILGAIIGAGLGNQLLPRFVISMYKNYVLGPPVISYDWSSIIIAIVLSMVVTVGAALFVVLKETRDSPSALMRPKAPKNAKKILLERIPFIWKRLKFNQKISYRNLFRFKTRGLMTILGIAGGTALILTGFGISNSISATANLQFKKVINYDLVLQSKTVQSLDSVRKTIESDKNYQSSTIVHTSTASARQNGKKVNDSTMYIPNSNNGLTGFITLKDYQNGEAMRLKSDGVIITQKMAKILNLKQGQSIEISVDGKRPTNFKVSGIAKNYVGNFIYMPRALYQQKIADNPKMQTLLVKIKNSSDADNNLAKNWMKKNSNILGISFVNDQSAIVDDMTKQLGPVVMIFILLSGLLSFIVLYNLNNINISERLRELSTIKVLGFLNPEVTMYVARESIILAALGIILGFGLGNLLTDYVIRQAETDTVVFPLTIEPIGYIVATVLMILFSLIVVYLTHRRLKKVDMVEALKSNE